MNFTEQDINLLNSRGISIDDATEQLRALREGFPSLDIVSPASVKDKSIIRLSKEEQDRYASLWRDYVRQNHTICKFVPASGAASRMFKDLFAYLETGIQTEAVSEFLTHLQDFAFAPQLGDRKEQAAVRYLLEDMHYGSLPKGLLLFHKYRDRPRTPAMEHLAEGAMVAEGTTKPVAVHFTVSHEHLPLFRQHIAETMQYMEKKFGCTFDISFSEQQPSTDTLAANTDGTPFRNADGTLLFRPGGHGALINNLQDIDADIIFLKNIDNIVPDRLKAATIHYKQVLAGVLIEEQNRVFELLRSCSLSAEEEKMLRRPIRVCGVVKNTGEPGGGPFLVREKDGRITKQILESSQIADKSLMARSTHFNPVDLVCATRDEKGNKYNLKQFVDPATGFISSKSKDGKELKALELPGLWNGAMSGWNTIFVEVPITTFNPVKTVNDLLRPAHQPKQRKQ